jgi:DNA-binding phage protein
MGTSFLEAPFSTAGGTILIRLSGIVSAREFMSQVAGRSIKVSQNGWSKPGSPFLWQSAPLA